MSLICKLVCNMLQLFEQALATLPWKQLTPLGSQYLTVVGAVSHLATPPVSLWEELTDSVHLCQVNRLSYSICVYLNSWAFLCFRQKLISLLFPEKVSFVCRQLTDICFIKEHNTETALFELIWRNDLLCLVTKWDNSYKQIYTVSATNWNCTVYKEYRM